MADIELVIKIPEEVYDFTMGAKTARFYNTEYYVNLILKGTPLPKGHGRLIDADYLREDFKASNKISFAERMDISCIVDHAPTIIEADKENEIKENNYFNEKESLYDELEHYLEKHSVGELLRTVASVVGKKIAKMEMAVDKDNK